MVDTIAVTVTDNLDAAYRAVLALTHRWVIENGAPPTFAVAVSSKSLVLTSCDKLVKYVERELILSLRRVEAGREDWPGGGEAPTHLKMWRP